MEIAKQKRILEMLKEDLSHLLYQLSNTSDEQRQEEIREAYYNLENRIGDIEELIEDLKDQKEGIIRI